ncbi:MAG TPA: exodeoxyribonuclease VII large subunit [Bacteroidia bacterium]|nr:exodeoxyribonuclease VII large subunit [Bacteroidia bacterium]HNP99138.1 exodeoxyribonuclease VII large subunit [Bacteroidia bacterium]
MVLPVTEIIPLKLSDLTRKVEQTIRQTFGEEFFWVVAEISGHKFYPNQDRHYFEFVEKLEGSSVETAKLKGIAWTQGAQAIRLFENGTGQLFGNGLQVLAKVKLDYHIVFGLQLILLDIDHSFTLGNLEKQRRQTLLRLVHENPDFIRFENGEYRTLNKEKEFGQVIQHIALIASPNSEGYTDFIHTLRSNEFGYTFDVDNYFSSVQGGEAERELIQTLVSIYSSQKAYDAVVMIRGGGAKTDFLVFDTYALSRAVAKFPIPLITGLGHHKDVSIVDLMANTNTKTPTKSAEFIISHNRKFEDKILETRQRVVIRIQQSLSLQQQRINAINSRLIDCAKNSLVLQKEDLHQHRQSILDETKNILFSKHKQLDQQLNLLSTKPRMIAQQGKLELNNLIDRIHTFTEKYFITQEGSLNHFSAIVKIMSPSSILQRGFAIVQSKGKIVKDAANIEAGEEIQITMQDAELKTKVIIKTQRDGNSTDL